MSKPITRSDRPGANAPRRGKHRPTRPPAIVARKPEVKKKSRSKDNAPSTNGPKISILMPTAARFQQGLLARAIDSAIAQTWTNFELLVVDDGSLDGTKAYLAECARRDSRIKPIRLDKNTGLPAFTLAQAYSQATGDYFAWLFDDCELMPDHLETLAGELLAHPDWGMVYGKARAQLTDDRHFPIGDPIDLVAMEKGTNFIPNVCVMVPRSTIMQVGWYDPHVLLKRLCDWDLWLRIAREFKIGFVDRTLAIEHGVGLAGSLGRLYHSNDALALRYAHTARNDRLAPALLTIEDAFRPDLGIELDVTEQSGLDFAFFEHAVLTMDLARSNSSARHLVDAGLVEAAMQRFEVQQGHRAGDDNERLFVSLIELMRRRLGQHAKEQIHAETTARAALEAADQRSVALQQLEALNADMQASMHRHEVDANAANSRAAGLESTMANEQQIAADNQRIHGLLLQDLMETRSSLLVFRDAAEHRLRSLDAANARIDELVELAEARLRYIRRLEQEAHAPKSGEKQPDMPDLGVGSEPSTPSFD